MGQSRATLKDIALATGFSVNTVSLAMRGSDRLPEATRSRIMKEAERLNYHPNHIARSLVNSKTRSIGLVMTDILNPTLTLSASTIEAELAKAGYAVMFASSHASVENEKRAIGMFRSYQVDGILVYPADRTQVDHIHQVDASGTPVLSLVEIPDAPLDCVAIDDAEGAFRAVRHLCRGGHKHIAMIDGHRVRGNSDKLSGARKAIAEAGLTNDALHVHRPVDHEPSSAAELMPAIMGGPVKPTAVFASTDNLALGVLHWCRENAVAVPRDMAVVGYDNTNVAALSVPGLTTVNYAADEISRIGVARILERIGGTEPARHAETRLIAPELIVRGSCGQALE